MAETDRGRPSMEDRQQRLKYLSEDAVQGFTAFCGFTAVSMEPGRFVSRVRIQPHHLQQDGFVHAGLIATLSDHTAGYASYTMVPKNRRILSVEFKINFLAPAAGEFLECRSRVIKPGRNLLVAESEVYALRGEAEVLVAKALLTMAAVPAGKLAAAKK
jgi:uncharacterized protein (TIGR00369 family)